MKTLTEIFVGLETILKNMPHIKDSKAVRHYVGLNYQSHLTMLREYNKTNPTPLDCEGLAQVYEDKWTTITGHDLYNDQPTQNIKY